MVQESLDDPRGLGLRGVPVSLASPLLRTGYAYVRVNGEDYGVYLNLETIDRVMLPRFWFGSTQHLYEGEYDAQGGVDVFPGNAGRFGVDQGDEADLSDLDALIAAVNGDGGVGQTEWRQSPTCSR